MEDNRIAGQEEEAARFGALRELCAKVLGYNPHCTSISFEYSGYGDNFNGFEMVSDEENGNPLAGKPFDGSGDPEVGGDLEEILWHFALQAGANENNDGCDGTITIDVVNRKMVVVNNAVVTDYETTTETHEF